MGSQTQKYMNATYGCSTERHNSHPKAPDLLPFSSTQGSLKSQFKWPCLIFTVVGKESKSTKPSTAGI